MLSEKFQIQAIANRLAGISEEVPETLFTDPWRTCWQALKDVPRESREMAIQALHEAVAAHPERERILSAIFAAQPQAAAERYPSLERMAARLKPITWLWRGWLPRGMLTVLGAAPGVGKSFLGMDLIWHVLHGTSYPDGSPVQRRSDKPVALYVDAEAIPQVIDERARTYAIDRKRLFLLAPDLNESLDFGEQKYQDRLVEMTAVLQPELIVIDSLSSIHTRGQNNVEDVRGLLRFLGSVAAGFDVGLLLIHHIRKPGNGQDMQAYNLSMSDLSGSGHIIAMARVVWGLHVVQTGPTPDPNGPRRLKMLKTNFGAYAPPLGFAFTPKDGSAVLRWLNTPPEDYRPPTKLDVCEEWLLEYLRQGPVQPSQAVEEGKRQGFSRAMVYRARKSLEGQIEDSVGKNSPQNRWRLRE